jgi:hypothetical protein
VQETEHEYLQLPNIKSVSLCWLVLATFGICAIVWRRILLCGNRNAKFGCLNKTTDSLVLSSGDPARVCTQCSWWCSTHQNYRNAICSTYYEWAVQYRCLCSCDVTSYWSLCVTGISSSCAVSQATHWRSHSINIHVGLCSPTQNFKFNSVMSFQNRIRFMIVKILSVFLTTSLQVHSHRQHFDITSHISMATESSSHRDKGIETWSSVPVPTHVSIPCCFLQGQEYDDISFRLMHPWRQVAWLWTSSHHM